MTLQIGTLNVDLQADVKGLVKANEAIAKSAKKLSDDMDKAAKAIAGDLGVTEKAAKDFLKQMKLVDQQGNRAAKGGLRSANHAFGQIGFQIQDAAVQLQMGTNALVVLGQQGSQLASIFGPRGAVIGALIAIGSAIAGSLMPALFNAKTATEELEIAMEGLDGVFRKTGDGVTILTEKMAKLSDEQLKVATSAKMIETAKGIKAAYDVVFEAIATGMDDSIWSRAWDNNFIQRTTKEIDDLLHVGKTAAAEFADIANALRRAPSMAGLEKLNDYTTDLANNTPMASERLRTMARDIQNTYLEAIRLQDSIPQLVDIFDDPGGAKSATESALTANERKREADRIRREEERSAAAIKRRLKQIKLLGETERDALKRKLLDDEKFIEENTYDHDTEMEMLRERAAVYNAELQKINDREAAQKEAAQERLKAIEERGIREQYMARRAGLVALSRLGATANEIALAAGAEGGKIAEAIFLAQKAINVASIISDTHAAAAAAGKAGSVGGGLAGFLASESTILAMGYANAALVSGLAVGQVAAGRQFGGPIQPMAAHPINEAGTPEILNQAGRQYLLPTGKGGTIEPMGKGSGTGQANVTIISNGTPQTVTGTQISRGEIAVMINDAGRATERRINGSLATGRGDTAASLQRGYKSTRNLR